MTTKKQKNSTRKIVWECIEALKEAHKSPRFIGKTELGKMIIIKFDNKIKLAYNFNQEEYDEYKKLEAELWGKK